MTEINGDIFMARLTNKEYLLRRKFLQRLWDFDETQKFYALLTPNKQQSLHLYYVTSNYDLSDEAAIDYRSKRTKSDAFSSGKAFNELYTITVNTAMRVNLDCDYADLNISRSCLISRTQLSASQEEGDKLGLTSDEPAFYDTLTKLRASMR